MKLNSSLFSFRSIRTELSCWFLLFALVPLLLVSAIGYWQARASLIESATQQLEQKSAHTMRFINNWFDYRWMDLNRLVDTELNVKFLEALSERHKESNMDIAEFVHSYEWTEIAHQYQSDLIKLARRYDYIYDIFLIDLEGNIIFAVAKESDFGTNLFDGPYSRTRFATAVRQSLEKGGTYFSDFEHYAPSAGLEAGFISAPLVDDLGEKIGAVSIQIRLDRIQSAFNVQVQDGTLHYLRGGDGILRTIIDNPSEVLVRNMQSQSFDSSSRGKVSGEIYESVKNYVGARGKAVIGLSHRVKVWNVDWVLVSEVDRREALASANWLGRLVLIILSLTAIIVFYLALIISRRITHPISQLEEATQGMADGQLDQLVELSVDNEIGRLANAYNHMIESRRAHEEDLVQAKLNAEQASLAKSEFLACMSHEIRTPMNGVLGMLALSLNSDVSADHKRKLLIAQSSAQSLLALINDILDYSKIEAGKLELEVLDFNLSDLLSEIATANSLKSNEKGVELILDIGSVDPSLVVRGDPSRLRQIIVNLLGNAIKFTREGEIILSAKVSVRNEKVCFQCSVKDTGIGIPEAKIPHLFDSFSQVDASTTREFGGTGLGLAICERLLKLTNGSISVQSEVGEGSTFSFEMEFERSARQPDALPVFDLQDTNILVLDDNSTNREIFRAQLEAVGARVSEAQGVDEALIMCRREKPYDVVIVDMQMPGKNGVDFANEVKQDAALAAMPLLLLSSVGEPEKYARLKEVGFLASLTKPVAPSDLNEALSLVLARDKKNGLTGRIITSAYLRSLKVVQDEGASVVQKWAANVRILLVEDNQINQEVVSGLLSEFNLVCDCAGNGIEALQSLRQAPDAAPYTLVFMDCQMPVMDGYEATRSIRSGDAGERNKNIPIVAMTANAMQGDREKCLDNGMNDYLSKPLDPKKVHGALLRWLEVEQENDEPVQEDNEKQSVRASQAGQSVDAQFKIPEGLKTLDLHNSPPDIARRPKSYLKILAMYPEHNKNFCEDLLRVSNAKDANAAREAVHAIKGASGNLGIVKVYEFAKTLEANIIETNAIQEGASEELVSLVQQSFLDVRLILEANGQAAISVSEADETIAGPTIKEIKAELMPLLKSSRAVPPSLLASLSEVGSKRYGVEQVTPILAALSGFDYDDAIDLLNKLSD